MCIGREIHLLLQRVVCFTCFCEDLEFLTSKFCVLAGLKVQESSMHELAAMAEAREADARAQIRALLDARCKLLEEGGDAQSMPKQVGEHSAI